MTTPQQIEQAIAKTKDEKSFIRELLQGALNWPVPESLETLDDISFDWSADELRAKGLSDKLVAGTVKQIRLADNQPWGIFLLEFKNEDAFTTGSGLAGPLRAVLRGLVPSRRQAGNLPAFGRENLLFICTHAYKHYRFAYFKAPVDGEKTAPLAAFGWSPGEPCRTACELNLPELAWPETPANWVAKWADAFSVEKVTKAFFDQYRTVFEKVEGLIEGAPSKDLLRLFTQRLFNRLMFIAFIQKKGWLRIDAMEHNDYLEGLWQSYQSAAGALTGSESAATNENFYNLRLRQLFFSALNTPNDVNRVALGTGQHAPKGLIQRLIGDVPYLNGGLFEKSDDGSDESLGINVPDKAIDAILHELFGRFNFTVAESTPLDIEVAVDPEMLGKVFEELVTGRHESGSYYTPRTVVSFMCREALKGYLPTVCNETAAAIAALVERHDPKHLANGERVLDALRKVRVCDPACGSGAYLLGMLHELIGLRACLFASNAKLDDKDAYSRKLDIIQTNLFGVDLDPFAVNTARLRLWLSLAVDYGGAIPEPLPNLDFKVEQGDSLVAPRPDRSDDAELYRATIQDFRHAKARMFDPNTTPKERAEAHLEASDLRAKISQWVQGTTSADAKVFDWRVDFADVCADGGFDVILANPPYVRADAKFKHIVDDGTRHAAVEAWRDYRARLVQSVDYETLYEKWDLFLPFVERSYQLLQRRGQMVLIIPDAFGLAKYAGRSRKLLVANACIRRIDLCSEIDLFDAGVNNIIIDIEKDSPAVDWVPLRVRRWGDDRSQFESNQEVMAAVRQSELDVAAFRPYLQGNTGTTFVKVAGIPLAQVCFISKGMVINSDESGSKGAFTALDLLSDTRDKIHCQRFVFGKDISRWCVTNNRYLEWNTDRSPGLLSRPTFLELQNAAVKLLAVRTPGRQPKITYDRDRLYFDASTVGFVAWIALRGVTNRSIRKSAKYCKELSAAERDGVVTRDEMEEISERFDVRYILGVLNSAWACEWLRVRRRSKLHVYPDDWKQLPIADAPEAEQKTIAVLVQNCLDAKGQNCEVWEKEIDERVAALYGL